MRELPADINEAIQSYRPVEVDGLMLYPIQVKHYGQYLVARQAIGFMQQSLPVELMSMPLLSALFKLDYDKTLNGEMPTGLFASCLVALAFALRLTKDYEAPLEACRRFMPVSDPNDQSQLKRLLFSMDDGEQWSIDPVQFAEIRQIIAAQNGIEIIDEEANPELVQAERDLA